LTANGAASGTALTAVVVGLTASGVLGVSRGASLAVTATLTAAGTLAYSGTTTTTITAGLTAAGVVDHHVITPTDRITTVPPAPRIVLVDARQALTVIEARVKTELVPPRNNNIEAVAARGPGVTVPQQDRSLRVPADARQLVLA
jgi:hypothetical protein